MEDNNIVPIAAAPAAEQAADGGPRRRLLQARRADDVGPLAVVVSASACITGLTAPVRTPAVVGAVLAGVVTLFVGLWLSTVGRGRGHRGIGFVNLCFSFLALVGAIAHGGEFDPELVLKIYNALAD